MNFRDLEHFYEISVGGEKTEAPSVPYEHVPELRYSIEVSSELKCITFSVSCQR